MDANRVGTEASRALRNVIARYELVENVRCVVQREKKRRERGAKKGDCSADRK